jgi:hypothetical protein
MPWSDCLVPPGTAAPDLVAEIRRTHGGRAPGWAARFAPVPWLVRTMCEMTSFPFAHLSVRDNSLIALVVSRDNSCRFCYGTQRALMRILGYQLDAIERRERGELSIRPGRAARSRLQRRSRVAPRGRARRNAPRSATPAARAVRGRAALSAAFTVFANRASTLVTLPPGPSNAPPTRSRDVCLAFPAATDQVRAPTRPSAPTSNEGVGADVVTALGTSPAARAASCDRRGLARRRAARTKLLMLAVIPVAHLPAIGQDARTALAAGHGRGRRHRRSITCDRRRSMRARRCSFVRPRDGAASRSRSRAAARAVGEWTEREELLDGRHRRSGEHALPGEASSSSSADLARLAA